jgi:hypothetical protein
MNEALTGAEALTLLEALLGDSGIDYRRMENGELRFLLLDSGRQWETVCRVRASTALFYGIYPFAFRKAGAEALALCGEINSELTQGAVFLKDGKALVRTGAELFDAYAANEAAARALEYNAGVVMAFWPRFAALRQE